MHFIFDYNLDNDILKNKKKYFFTFLSDRFFLVNNKISKILNNHEPIYILSEKPQKDFAIKNYIIFKYKNKKDNNNWKYDDLNNFFSNNKFINDLVDDLYKKQSKIPLISFMSQQLTLNDKIKNKIKLICPDNKISDFLDDKVNQIKIFNKLKISIPKTKIYKNFNFILKDINNIKFPIFISSFTTKGGEGNAVVYNKKELEVFYKKIKDKDSKKGKFFIAKYIENVVISPTSHAIILGKNKVQVVNISDQILSGIKYEGNIHPSKANYENQEKIKEIMIKLGKYFSKLGFRGFFGCDFIIDKNDNLYISEVNPRRMAHYLMILLMSKKIDLLNIELSIFLGKKNPEFTYDDLQCDFAWCNKKIKSDTGFAITKKEIKKNTEETPFNNIGSEFYCTYFSKGKLLNSHIFGYYITTGTDYDEVLKRAQRRTNILKKQLIEEVNEKELNKK